MRGAAAVALLLGLASGPAPPPQRRIAVTFDDLPFVRLRGPVEYAVRDTGKILAALNRRGVTATGFVNEARLDDDRRPATMTALLEIWLDAGHTLGNHGYAHMGLNATPPDVYARDARRGAEVIARLSRARGRACDLFRPPFGQTGATPGLRAAFDGMLAKERWRLAPYTVEVRDFIYNRVYVDALEAQDAPLAGRIREAYVDQFDVSLAFFERLSRDVFSREIPQVLLVHANELAADAFGDALDRIAARGYAFIPLDAALGDPAYETPDRWVSAEAPSWLHRWAHARGLASREREEPRPPRWVLDLFDASLRRHAAARAAQEPAGGP